MEELVKTFYIDWKLIIAQAVNFAIVLGVLWYFALEPLQKVMNKRSDDIAKSLEDAKEIEKKLVATDEDRTKILTKAKQGAQEIVKQAYAIGEKKRQEMLDITKQETNEIVVQAKQQIAAAKERLKQELRQETAELVIKATQKVIQDSGVKKPDSREVNEVLKNLDR